MIRKFLLGLCGLALALGTTLVVSESPASASIPDAYDVGLFFRVHSGDAVQHWPYTSVCTMTPGAVVYGSMYGHPNSTNSGIAYYHFRLHYLFSDGHWANIATDVDTWNDMCPGPYPG